jgi:hypothetical protein
MKLQPDISYNACGFCAVFATHNKTDANCRISSLVRIFLIHVRSKIKNMHAACVSAKKLP